MEGTKAFISFQKTNGELGPGQVLEDNKIFIIGSERGSDIRLHKTSRPIKYIFELNKDGLVTVTDETDSTSSKQIIQNGESFEVEGKTFLVKYLSSDEVTSQQNVTQRRNRLSCFPSILTENIKISSIKSEIVTRTPRRTSTTSDSGDNSSAPGTPVPAMNTPSVRRSMMKRMSMAPLPEEDESNSNDSKYKTPDNATPPVVMRQHKSANKHNFDGECTPKCTTPVSNIKSRRSLLLQDANTLKDSPLASPSTSDDDISDKDGLTITNTSDSCSGTEVNTSNGDISTIDEDIDDGGDIDIVVEEPDIVDQSLFVERLPKRGRKDVDDSDEDEGSEQVFEPPKKRMKRETAHSFRDLSTSSSKQSQKRNSSLYSKKSMEYAKRAVSLSSIPNTLPSAINPSRSIITSAPNTLPRLKKSKHKFAPSSRKSLQANRSAEEDQENISFEEYADKSPSPQAMPIEFVNGDEANDSDTTHSSSFDYIHGKDAEIGSLGMSVFNVDQKDLPENGAGDDLMEFSTHHSTPDKNGLESSYSIGRKSSRSVKRPKVYTPDHPTINNETVVKTPGRRIISTPLVNLSTLANSAVRKSNRPLTPTTFPDFVVTPLTPRRKARIERSMHNSLLESSKNKRIQSQSLVKSPKRSLHSEVRKSNHIRTPLSPRSLQKNPVVACVRFDSPFEAKKSAKKDNRTSKTPKANTTFDLNDSFSEFRESSRVQTPFLQKKTDLAKSLMSNNSTPIRVDSSKQNSSINSNKSFDLLEESLSGLRRSNRTPKSVFRRNSILDESIFDTSTSTKQSLSMSRSLSMGHSMSSNSISNSYVKSIEKSQAQMKTKKSTSPTNDLTDVQGVKQLMRTLKVQKEPKNDLTDVRGVGKLLKTPKPMKEAANDLSDLRGVKTILKTPKIIAQPKNDLTNVTGVKQLMRTPKVQKEPKNDLSDVRGVGKLLKTPKPMKEPTNDLSDLRGVKTILKTPKIITQPKNDLTNVAGVKQLLRTPKVQNHPKNDLTDVRGVGKLMKTPKQYKDPLNDLTDVKGVKSLMRTPKESKPVKNDLTNVAGVKRLLGTPILVKGPKNDLSDVFGLKKLMKTPRNQTSHTADYTNVSGVGQLFNLPEDDSEEVNVTSTSSVSVKKARAARSGKGKSVEIEQEAIIVAPKRTRGKKAEVLPVEEIPVVKKRTMNRRAPIKEVEEIPTPPPIVIRRNKRPSKKQAEETEVIEESPLQVKPKRGYTRKRIVKEVEEIPMEDTEAHQVEEVSSTIPAKGKAASRKRVGTTKKTAVEEEVEDDFEPVEKKARGRPKGKQVKKAQIDIDVKKPRGRKAVQKDIDDDDDDTVFTSVEEIDVKAPAKAARVVRTRRGRGAAATEQTEDSHDIESTEDFTKVVVRKDARSNLRVQFHEDVKTVTAPATKRPKTRRLLSIDDIDEMSEEPEIIPVAPSTRKSARSRK